MDILTEDGSFPIFESQVHPQFSIQFQEASSLKPLDANQYTHDYQALVNVARPR